MILNIDTISDPAKIGLFSCDNFRVLDFCETKTGILSEELLLKIQQLLSVNNLRPLDLKMILVNCGPGPYTGLRIGVTTANLLAFSLDIPVANNSSDDSEKIKKLYRQKSNHFINPVIPIYQNLPHITKKNHRR